MVDLPQTNIFWGKIFNIIFIYLLIHFIVPNFKNFLQETQGYEDAPFLDPKWDNFPKQKFFRKTVDKPTISFVIFWDLSMFYPIFFSPQMKWWTIITYKHGIYELPHELPNNLRLRILGN